MEDSPRSLDFREEFEPFLKDGLIKSYEITQPKPGVTECTCVMQTLEGFAFHLQCSYMSYKVVPPLSF